MEALYLYGIYCLHPSFAFCTPSICKNPINTPSKYWKVRVVWVVRFVSDEHGSGWCKLVFSGSVFVNKISWFCCCIFIWCRDCKKWVEVYCRNHFLKMTFGKWNLKWIEGWMNRLWKTFFIVTFCIKEIIFWNERCEEKWL